MLKRLIYLLLLIVAPLLAFSDDAGPALFKKGNNLYQKANYKEAAAAYQKMVDDGYQSASLYFNLGNAYYKNGDIAPALLYYEKAHRLSPGDEDIRVNIQFANSKTTDKIEAAPEFFITKWWTGFILAFSANALAVVSVLLFLAASGLLILYRFSGSVGIKKASFYSALILLLLGIGTIFISGRQAAYFDAHHDGIIFNSSVNVKNAPATTAKNGFVLHEGTKVNILDKKSDWVKIKLANGNEGWVSTADVREI
ncbi:tetratricopeptide repeat protein [Mucilaginibacter sp. AW1-7]|jgi:tetratricopeptide (TPR) repeat protein|uniref:tetratricopeptide repeat protein n=1 Tax=unclassified Mucilaginibacter TaxID=2617802 RepID=UPI0008BCF586|nr:tetratricopeptide repeat protein [Mucilaginibacter sp. OK283]SEO33861.1 Tetratricopeptide repeat-containing protein [Mucilaginibacter sp. OK283]